jgi:hypothetical protein
MIALRANQTGEEQPQVVLHGLAFCAVVGLTAACSESQYNPTLPEGGSGGGTASAGAGAGGGSSGSGSSGAGGSAGTPGGAGSGGSGNPGVTQTYAFASGLEGFRVNYACTGIPFVCAPVMDAAPAGDADAGADAGGDAGGEPAPVMSDFFLTEFDAAVGDPEVGSAKLTLQFGADGQLADFARNFGSNVMTGLDLAGKTISARARVEPGGAPTVAAKMYLKTGETYSYGDSGEVTLTPGTWTTVSYTIPTYYANMAVYNMADVREVGIEILGRGATAVTPTVVHIDTISY